MTKMTKVHALNYAIDAVCEMGWDNGSEITDILGTMVTQLSKPRKTSDEAKAKRKEKNAQARAALMEQVLPVIREGISDGGTAKEIFERCKESLPKDFSDKKVQYILLHEMAEEVEKIEAKGKANVYKKKA